MSEVRQLLERQLERIPPPSFTEADVMRRRDRTARRRRVSGALIALAIFGSPVAWFAWTLGPNERREAVPAAQPQEVDREARRAYIRDFQAVCRPVSRQLLEPPILASRSGYSGENVKSFRTLAPIYGRFVRDIAALPSPPGDEEAAHITDRFRQSLASLSPVLHAADQRDASAFEEAAGMFWLRVNAAFMAADDAGIRCS
ncbi:MAG TPA: hypothetical protein VE962_07820 [Actinomycetota bacterium]|jgi:hypothetical protein|nr:hypothetical protein [Actinomycetota bacterium]